MEIAMVIAREQPEEEGEESYGPIGDLVEGRNDTNQNTTKHRAKLMKSLLQWRLGIIC